MLHRQTLSKIVDTAVLNNTALDKIKTNRFVSDESHGVLIETLVPTEDWLILMSS